MDANNDTALLDEARLNELLQLARTQPAWTLVGISPPSPGPYIILTYPPALLELDPWAGPDEAMLPHIETFFSEMLTGAEGPTLAEARVVLELHELWTDLRATIQERFEAEEERED